jgi:hypothetical protein
MNVELEKDFSCSCILVDKDTLPMINHYDIRVSMRVATSNTREYNLAYGRVSCWFSEIMQDSVLIEKDHDKFSVWKSTGLRCMDFPIAPMDQVLGLMLMSKLRAITEGRIDIEKIRLCSPADDHIIYICDQGDDLHWFEKTGWWNDSSPMYTNHVKKNTNAGKVISLSRSAGWDEFSLGWPEIENSTGNISILPTFGKDE